MTFDYESQKKTLFLVSEILEKNHFKKKCNMGFGLFLGCIRSGNLNTKNNDSDDLDFNVLDENWEELVEIIIPDLLASGFDILHSFENTHGDISEITIGYGKDRIDFHKNYKLKTGYLHYLESVTKELKPNESYTPVHLWHNFGMNTLQEVRNRWNQLIGNTLFSSEEESTGPKTIEAFEIKLVGENVIQIGETITASLEIFIASPYPLPGQLSLKLPKNWEGYGGPTK